MTLLATPSALFVGMLVEHLFQFLIGMIAHSRLVCERRIRLFTNGTVSIPHRHDSTENKMNKNQIILNVSIPHRHDSTKQHEIITLFISIST